jgi:recombination protein RecA
MSKKKEKEIVEEQEVQVKEKEKEKIKKATKKVKTEEVIDAKDAFEMTSNVIETKFKDTFHAWLYEEEKMRQYRFSSGCIGLDTAMGGEGLPEGRMIEFWGPPSSGKTSFALEVAWHRQQQALAKRAAGDLSVPVGIVFIDAEHKFDRSLLQRWRGGFHPQFTKFLEPYSGEDAFGLMRAYAESAGTSLIVLDSISAVEPLERLLSDDSSSNFGPQALFIRNNLPKLAGAAARTGVPMIIVNQVRHNMKATQYSGGANRYNKAGGYSLKHWVSVSIFFDKFQSGYKKGSKGSDGRYVQETSLYKGQWTRGTIFRNHSGDTFFNTFEVFLEYGRRFLTAAEILRMGIALGVIKQGGGGNYTIYDEHVRGLDFATQYIDTDQKLLDKLWNDIRSIQLIGKTPISDVNSLEEGDLPVEAGDE